MVFKLYFLSKEHYWTLLCVFFAFKFCLFSFTFRFQELDLSAEALVFNDSSREDSWLKAIENGLPKETHYFRVYGMFLSVFSCNT